MREAQGIVLPDKQGRGLPEVDRARGSLLGLDDIYVDVNNACAKILSDLSAIEDDGEIGENPDFVLTCHPQLKHRIYKALAAGYLNPNTNINKVIHNISAVVVTGKLASTSYYVSLPGLKNKRGEWEDLNAKEPQRNELKLGADYVWTGAYNGIIGESKQHRRLALSA